MGRSTRKEQDEETTEEKTYNDSDLNSGSDDSGAESDDETHGFKTTKQRFRLNLNKAGSLATTPDFEDEEESDGSESDEEDEQIVEQSEAINPEVRAQEEIEKLTEKGPLGDVYPYGGDAEGARGYRCVHCPSKRMQSDQDVLIHLQSKAHRRRFKAVLAQKRTLLAKARNELPKRVLVNREKKEARAAAAKEKRKAKLAEKRKNLTEEQIEKLKQKRAAKTERRMKRKFGDEARPVQVAAKKKAKKAEGSSSAKKRSKSKGRSK